MEIQLEHRKIISDYKKYITKINFATNCHKQNFGQKISRWEVNNVINIPLIFYILRYKALSECINLLFQLSRNEIDKNKYE